MIRWWQRRRRWRRMERFAQPRRHPVLPGDQVLICDVAPGRAFRVLPGEDWSVVVDRLRLDRETARAMRGGIDWPGAA